MKRAIILTVLLGLSFTPMAAADPGDTLWTRTYGGSYDDCGYSVQQTSDGGYIIAGYTSSFGAGGSDFYLLKTDSSGDTTWTRTYGGSDSDWGWSVQQTSDGGYVIAGATWSFGAGLTDMYLLKTDSSGDTIWTRTYGGSDLDEAWSVQQTSDGGYVIAGEIWSSGGTTYDVCLLKTDSSGDTLWTCTYGGSEWDRGRSVQQTSDGGYIIAGYTYSFGAGCTDVYLVKTDSSGDTLWTRTYGGSSDDLGWSVQQTSHGGYVIAGTTFSFGAGSNDVYLVKTDSSGDTLWTRTYGGSDLDYGNSVQQTSDGGYIIAGGTRSFGIGARDVYLIKTNSSGDTLWTRTYGGSSGDAGYSVQQTTDGGYIIAGYTESFGAGGSDVYLVRVAGEQLPVVSIEIVPDDPPVTVPQGGSFGFTGTLTNNTDQPQVVDVWTIAVGPEKKIYGPFKEFYDVELAPNDTIVAHFYQHVAYVAPLGFYDYIAYCGDYDWNVIDFSSFHGEVIPAIFSGGEDLGWLLTGSFDKGDDFSGVPSEFALRGNYPNPFNASTVIEYQLPVTTDVKLEVYNLLGEKVTTLADEMQEAGYKSVNWDASKVSSGLYFYKLTAGDFTETRRMMLVK